MAAGIPAVPRAPAPGGEAAQRDGVRAGPAGTVPRRSGHGRVPPGHRLHRGRHEDQSCALLRPVHVVSKGSFTLSESERESKFFL